MSTRDGYTFSITRGQLRRALLNWCIAARSGETRSMQETAAMSADDVAESGVEHLLHLLGVDVDTQMALPLDADVKPAQGAQFVAGEDIAAGQIVTFNDLGRVVVFVSDEPAEKSAEKPAEPEGFNFGE